MKILDIKEMSKYQGNRLLLHNKHRPLKFLDLVHSTYVAIDLLN